jgi:UDP-N-acetylmuramoyl-L-alanyl-D-glutamate--2,6-diaminopimelate ligase
MALEIRIDEALRGVRLLESTESVITISGVQYDSRRVRSGDLFVAMRGETTDGNRYIERAVAQGARAVITDSHEVWENQRFRYRDIPFHLAANGRRALAEVSTAFFGHPERALKISAVTGTNGKTTTAYLLEQLLRSAGRKCVLMGTVETRIADQVRSSPHTTPESRDILEVFAEGVRAGCTEVVMEMSSHALAQERVWGLPVDVAMFTNLTQDHLDFHGSMEAYFAAKARLFAGVGVPPPRRSVINVDDPAGVAMSARIAEEAAMLYGMVSVDVRYCADDVVLRAGETRFRWVTPQGSAQVSTPLTGEVNVYNWLAASCAALARGLTMEQIVAASSELAAAPGRFEVVPASRAAGFSVVVDYAHTDDALKNLLRIARNLAGSGRVITLFGCGGDRDRTKRPKMGRVAAEMSDVIVLTSDNPRSEDPSRIIGEVLVGVRDAGGDALVEPDRRAAIELAIKEAQPGDIVLLAGKGHEKTQTFADRTVAFDDIAEAERVLREGGR